MASSLGRQSFCEQLFIPPGSVWIPSPKRGLVRHSLGRVRGTFLGLQGPQWTLVESVSVTVELVVDPLADVFASVPSGLSSRLT